MVIGRRGWRDALFGVVKHAMRGSSYNIGAAAVTHRSLSPTLRKELSIVKIILEMLSGIAALPLRQRVIISKRSMANVACPIGAPQFFYQYPELCCREARLLCISLVLIDRASSHPCSTTWSNAEKIRD